ncbi:MAG: hypothetical protein LBC51_11115 [Treponema sp.]|jgi:chitodextrinase|nr:hypothetical protein [Treponema sp.]
MNKHEKPLGLWLSLAVVALVLSLSGCEQILGKENSGEFGGADGILHDPGRAAVPGVSTVGKGVVLTWTATEHTTYQQIVRRKTEDSREDAYPVALITKDRLEMEELPAGTYQYTDYFTEAGVEYIYYIIAGSMQDKSMYIESRDTEPVRGLNTDPDVQEGEIGVSYDQNTGLLTFTPALPPIPSFPALGEPKAALSFDNGIEAQVLTFPAEMDKVNLSELLFNDNFDTMQPLDIGYDPVYEKQSEGVYITNYPNHEVRFTGNQVPEGGWWLAGVIIPERKVPVPEVPDVEITVVRSSSIRLAWDAVDGASQYKVYRNNTFISATTDTFYLDMGLSPETAYTYEVTAVNRSGESAKSPTESGTTASNTQTLSEGTLLENFLSRGDVHYYQIAGDDAYTYDVFWQDADTAQEYTADIQAGAKTGKDATAYLTALTNEGNTISFTPSTDGAIFIEVQGFTPVTSGRYTIRYTKRAKEVELALPDMPQGLAAASTTDTAISLTWTSVSGASYYKVYRDDVYLNQTDTPSYTDTGLSPSRTYTYKVSGVNSRGEGAKASVQAATSAPVNGEASAISLSTSSTSNVLTGGQKHYYSLSTVAGIRYLIRWHDKDTIAGYGDVQVGVKTPGAASYDVVALTDTGNTDTRNKIAFTHTGQVIIVVENYSASGGSYSIWYETEAQAQRPSAPNNLRVTGFGAYQVNLAWDAVSGATAYRIYRNGTYLRETAYSGQGDNSVSPNTAYTYRVSAVNSAGESSYSNEVRVATDPASTRSLGQYNYYTLSPGETHYFPFTGHGTYYIRWADRDNTSGYADIKVGIRPRGELGWSTSLGDHGNSITLSANGDYIIVVQGFSSTSSGTYRIWSASY